MPSRAICSPIISASSLEHGCFGEETMGIDIGSALCECVLCECVCVCNRSRSNTYRYFMGEGRDQTALARCMDMTTIYNT